MGLTSIVETIKNIGRGIDNRISESGKGITSTSSLFGMSESPDIKHKDLLNILRKDGTANFVITATVNAAVGLGYHYKSDMTPEGDEQVQLLEEWNNSKAVMMRGKNVEIGRYMYGMGFAPVELVSLDFLTEIPSLPMEADWQFMREPRGGKITDYLEWFAGQVVDFKADEIVPFHMNTSADFPLGRGVLHNLAETDKVRLIYSDATQNRSVQRFSLYRARTLITADIVKLIHNGVPKSLWKMRIKDSHMTEASKRVETMEPGQRLLTNASDIDIKTESADVRTGYSAIVGDFDDLYAVALMSFLPKFFSKTPWTESSSLTAERIWYNALVQNFQDSFREQKVIRIDDLILKQMGFTENHTTYVWGMPQPPRLEQNLIIGVMAQVSTAFQAGYIDEEFARQTFLAMLDALGDAGLAINTRVSSTDDVPGASTEMAKALLDGDISFDSRKLAETYFANLSKSQSIQKNKGARKIAI